MLDPILDNIEWTRRERALAEYLIEQLGPDGEGLEEYKKKLKGDGSIPVIPSTEDDPE